MTELKRTKELETRAKKILSERVNEISALEDLINDDTLAIENATKEMAEATNSGDLKAYQEAKGKRRDSEDSKEMHETRLDFLNNKALITKEEYEKSCAEIFSEIADLELESKKKLAKLSEQMEAVSLDLKTATSRANEVLHIFQHDVYRDADRSHNYKGEVRELASETKSINKSDTINWGMAGVKNQQYELITGRKIQRENGRIL